MRWIVWLLFGAWGYWSVCVALDGFVPARLSNQVWAGLSGILVCWLMIGAEMRSRRDRRRRREWDQAFDWWRTRALAPMDRGSGNPPSADSEVLGQDAGGAAGGAPEMRLSRTKLERLRGTDTWANQ